MGTVIDLDALKSTETISLGEHGVVEIRRLNGADEWTLHGALTRPGRARADLVALEALSRCSGLGLAQVRALSLAHRRRLTAAVVRVNEWQGDWAALYGSHLNADERLLAVASWHYARAHSAVTFRLREIRERHRADAQRRVPAVGEAQMAPISAAVAKAHQLVVAQQHASKASAALTDFHKMVAFGGAMPTLLAATRPNPVFAAVSGRRPLLPAVSLPPSFAATVRQASGFSNALLGLDHTRQRIARVTAGLTVAKPPITGITGPRLPIAGWKAATAPGLANAFAGLKPTLGISESLRTLGLSAMNDSVAARLRDVVSPMARFDVFRSWHDGFAETWTILDQFSDTWEDEALWYLFSSLSIGASAKLGRLPREEVEPVVFDALERVFADPELLDAFIQHLDLIPDLVGPHRDQMREALEFARVGKYHIAQPLLHVAFESMLYRAALRQGLNGNVSAAEGLLKLLFSSGDRFLNFMIRMVFGGHGNPYRHGRTTDGHRELMLAGMVALAGYMDWATGTHAIEIVAGRMEEQLDPAIEAVKTSRVAALTAGS